MSLSQDITPVLHRNASADADAQILAVLCAVKTRRIAVRDWLRRYAGPDIASVVSDDARWDGLVKTAKKHISSSPSARRRDIARRAVTHALRDYPGATASQRRRCACSLLSSAPTMLAHPDTWDTWVGNARNLGARLNIDRDTARDWLALACDPRRPEASRWQDEERGAALRAETVADLAPSVGCRKGGLRVDSRGRTEPRRAVDSERGASRLHFNRVKVTEGAPHVNQNALTPLAWEASVLWAAGVKTPTKRLRELHPADVSDLDLRWEAVAPR